MKAVTGKRLARLAEIKGLDSGENKGKPPCLHEGRKSREAGDSNSRKQDTEDRIANIFDENHSCF